MLFKIIRASQLLSDESPCDTALQIDDKWYMNFSSLEELVTFTDKEGHIIFERGEIWIYDDYME